jgi:hypothetical protein
MSLTELRRLLKVMTDVLGRATPVLLALLEALSRRRTRKPPQ